jgi:GNAT superfamily N-acetyltransferase
VSDVDYREASSVDVPAVERSRAADHDAGPADGRMAAYLDGQHHPQQALPTRTAFVALIGRDVVGYIAGHATTRHGCAGEVQYLYVAPLFRRRGIAATLLRLLAAWFSERGIRRVCVNADIDSPGAVAFYVAFEAVPLSKFWYVWEDIGVLTTNRADDDRTRSSHADERRL